MLRAEEKPDGTIRIHFTDNTYRTLPLKIDTLVNDVIEWLCKRLSIGGRVVDPKRHELFIITPGTQALRERCLSRDDKPLVIQVQGGSQAFKFLFREVVDSAANANDSEAGLQPVRDEEAAKDGDLSAGSSAAISSKGAELLSPAMVSGAIRTGSVERPVETSAGAAWRSCMLILTEDRLWYSEDPVSAEGSFGGGMASLTLRDCDRVVECEDKRQLCLLARGGTHTFRARNASERTSWLLAIARQYALVKERGILDEAEQAIANVEWKRAEEQARRLEAFETPSTIICVREARELLLSFARQECEGGCSWWHPNVTIDDLVACLEKRRSGCNVSSVDNPTTTFHGADEATWLFVEETLFPRFLFEHSHQAALCRMAAGLF